MEAKITIKCLLKNILVVIEGMILKVKILIMNIEGNNLLIKNNTVAIVTIERTTVVIPISTREDIKEGMILCTI